MAFLKTLTLSISAIGLCAATASSAGQAQRVAGYLCNSKADQIAFLTRQAAGENEIMAADAINKSRGMMTCAPYMSVTAIPTGDHTVMDRGIVFSVQSYLTLPERMERWAGKTFGVLQNTTKQRLHDI